MSAIQSMKLKGHQGAVLCLDHSSSVHQHPSSSTACLLSGSEDATARLWDLRAPLRASVCIKTQGEVLAVSFGPSCDSDSNETRRQLASPFARDYTVYLSTGSRVFAYDLRKTTFPIIAQPIRDYTDILESPDDVNQIGFLVDKKKKGRSSNTLLAACDDGGSVRLCPCSSTTTNSNPRRILVHGDNAMVTSVAVRPRSKQLELASGGTDCTVQLWNVQQQRQWSTVTIPSTDTSANQVCNPPMVHSLEWSPSGRLLAAACGDGTCCLFGAENRSLVLVARLENSTSPLACVVFPQWTSSSLHNHHVAAHDRFLVTAGNDGNISLWDLGPLLAGEGATDPTRLVQLTIDETTTEDTAVNMQGLSLHDNPHVLGSIPHGHKPNWMVSSRGRDPVFPSTLFLADTSHDITAYTIPLQS